MLLETIESRKDKRLIARLKGKPTFGDALKFRDIRKMLTEDDIEIIELDMEALETMDATILGSIFLLLEIADRLNKQLIIKRPNGPTKQMLVSAQVEYC